MNEFKGTPGPWSVYANTSIEAELDGFICQAYGDSTSWEQDHANAKLIAAAPDLLNCLTMGQTMQTPEFLEWIADRLVHIHSEHASCDFIISLRKRAAEMKNARDKALGLGTDK